MNLAPLTCLLAATVLLSCSTMPTSEDYTQQLKRWRSQPASVLLSRWGQPDLRLSGVGKTQLYGYHSPSYQRNNRPYSAQIGVHLSPDGKPMIVSFNQAPEIAQRSSEPYCLSLFLVNTQGLIIDTQVKGLSCYGDAHLDNIDKKEKS